MPSNISRTIYQIKRYLRKHMDEINQLFPKKPYKISFEDKLDKIMYVLRYDVPWCAIEGTGDESSYRKFFNKLSEINFFEKAFKKLIKEADKKNLLKKNNLFIDSTTITNSNTGSKDLCNWGHFQKHRTCKIHEIINEDGIPLTYSLSKGSVKDNVEVSCLVENINYMNLKKAKLIGDSGYISTKIKTYLKKKRGLRYIYKYIDYTKSKAKSKDGTPRYKKIYPKNTDNEKKLLKKRILVEHFMAILKQYRRIRQMNERKISNYNSFVGLANLCITLNKLTDKVGVIQIDSIF